MTNLVARFAKRLALMTFAAALSSGTLGAQGVKVSAWIGARPITAGNDSGKVFLVVQISGISETAIRSLKRDQIVLRAESGRVYLPFGAPPPVPSTASATVVAHFYQVEAKSAGRYVFIVRPGDLRYQLWLPGHSPVSVAASLVRSERR
jgi:hypothetical protein